MDFRLTDEQQLLIDTARSVFANECPSSVVRATAEDATAGWPLFDRHLRDWVALGDGDVVDLVLFCIEAGAAVAPGPFLATAAGFVPLLRAIDHADADAAAAGELTGTVAIAGPDGAWCINDASTREQVIDLHLVDRVALVSTAGVAVIDADELDADELQLTVIEGMDQARQLHAVRVPDGLAWTPVDASIVDRVIAGMTLAVAAESVGVSRWIQEASVAYATQRVQFGKPIGSFQGLQYRMVDAALRHERAAAAVAYAAMCLDAGDQDATRAVHVAKTEAGLAARGWAKDGMQVHGGIGYTWEHDLHLRLRRAYGNDALCGTASWHLDRLAELIFDGD